MLGLDADDLELRRDVLVAGDEHAAADGPADGEGVLEAHLEPGAELSGVGQRPPDAGTRAPSG